MDVESARRPDEVGSSVRRNPFQLSPSSFHKILKKKLMLVPFRYVCLKTLVIHHHSIQAPQTSEAVTCIHVTCIHSISIRADPHDDLLKINNFKGSTIIANLRGGPVLILVNFRGGPVLIL